MSINPSSKLILLVMALVVVLVALLDIGRDRMNEE